MYINVSIGNDHCRMDSQWNCSNNDTGLMHIQEVGTRQYVYVQCPSRRRLVDLGILWVVKPNPGFWAVILTKYSLSDQSADKWIFIQLFPHFQIFPNVPTCQGRTANEKRLLLTYFFVAEELYEDHQVLIPAQVFFGLRKFSEILKN